MSEEAEAYARWEAEQDRERALDELHGAGIQAEHQAQHMNRLEDRIRFLDGLRRQKDRKLHWLKVETQRLRRAHRRERERAEQAISFLRVYRQQPGMDWPDVAAFLDADGPF